jgi:hypothetical protein
MPLRSIHLDKLEKKKWNNHIFMHNWTTTGGALRGGTGMFDVSPSKNANGCSAL